MFEVASSHIAVTSEALSGGTRISKFEEQRRDAMRRWAEHVMTVVG